MCNVLFSGELQLYCKNNLISCFLVVQESIIQISSQAKTGSCNNSLNLNKAKSFYNYCKKKKKNTHCSLYFMYLIKIAIYTYSK